MATWQCISSCGACCHLAPQDRPDLPDYLTPAQLGQYLALVGEDGWCINYDKATRTCLIYNDRPDFCRVTPATFEAMFGVSPDDLDEFAIACCQDHIRDIYGEQSTELARFNQAVGALLD
jgi:Fe-S-cluster containining protein